MNKHSRVKLIIEILIIFVAIPAVLIISWRFGDRHYYLFSVIVMILVIIPFFVHFERRSPSAREMVTIAVMAAIATAARAAFVMVPHFTPMSGIIMISGIALGPEAGFLVGALTAFASNFVFGQGPWTPWQMFAYGMAGLLAALLAKKGIMGSKNIVRTAVIGGLLILCIIGPLLDTATLFLAPMMVNGASAKAIYLSGLPVNAIHGAVTAVTLLILCRPIQEKLDRIKVKYGMMED